MESSVQAKPCSNPGKHRAIKSGKNRPSISLKVLRQWIAPVSVPLVTWCARMVSKAEKAYCSAHAESPVRRANAKKTSARVARRSGETDGLEGPSWNILRRGSHNRPSWYFLTFKSADWE